MKNLKILFPKFLLLVVFLVGMNYLYQYFFLEKDLQEHSSIINLTRNVVQDSCEIVYVGESSNITNRWDDKDKRSISAFISEYFPGKKMGDITHPASHAGIYYELLRNIPENSTVKTVIVTLNMRSFDAGWIYSNLETPLQKDILLLKDRPALFNRFVLSFKGYDIKTDLQRQKQVIEHYNKDILHFPYPFAYKTVAEWDKMMSNQNIVNTDTTSTINLTELACHYIKTYAFQIDTLANPRIKDYDKIVQLAKKRGWNLIFCLMAENVEKARQLVGDDLLFLMKQNRDLLVNRYTNLGVTVVDNLTLVPDEEFIDQDWTTEHYAEKGRKAVAHHIVNSLQKFYPNDYCQVIYEEHSSYEFFNDCEGKVIWIQNHTLTNERCHSYHKSSKTGGSEQYGLTFEYAIANLPDSICQVTAEMYVYQEDNKHNAVLALEINGENATKMSFPLQSLVFKVNQWEKIMHTFTFDKDFYNNKIIKIYLYNPTNTTIFIDDIKIKFQK